MQSHDTILLIEDNPGDALLFQKAVTRENIRCPVQVMSNGQEAIRYLKGEGVYHDRILFPFPQIIFTDLEMPCVDGLGVLTWLKKHPKYCVIPVIVLSGTSDAALIKQAHQLGANSLLRKPTDFHELRALLKSALNFWSISQIPRC